MKWYDTETGLPTVDVSKPQKKHSLTDVLLWITLAGFAIVALFILAPLLESGGHKQTTSTGYVGSLQMDPTMVAVMETVAVDGVLQQALQQTQVALLEGIQPTATPTPKKTATRNPTPKPPACDVANAGDLCLMPRIRETPVPKATQTPTWNCSMVTPSPDMPILCIKDESNDGMEAK